MIRLIGLPVVVISAWVLYGFWGLYKDHRQVLPWLVASTSLTSISLPLTVAAFVSSSSLATWMAAVAQLLVIPAVVGLWYGRASTAQHLKSVTDENLRHHAIMDAMDQGVLVCGADGTVIECNPTAEKLLGVSARALVGIPIEQMGLTLLKEDGNPLPERRNPVVISLRSGRDVPPTVIGVQHSKRKTVWLSVRAYPLAGFDAGSSGSVVAYFSDITRHRGRETHLYQLATEDPLTGLLNRRALEEQLRSSKLHEGHGSALLMLDLDNFKVINDMLGHASGDEALIRVSRVFQNSVRPSDTVARVGGDEFVVLLRNVSYDEARAIAENLRHAVSTFEYKVSGHRFQLGVSIGMTMVDESLEPRGVLMLADSALQEAKKTGKNRIVVHADSPEASARLTEFNRWAGRIKDALAQDRFLLHFQPIISLEDDVVRSFEALLRMRGKSGRLFQPEPFISAAEYFNLMPEIDQWVVERCIDILQREPELRIFVNLSATSLNNDALLERITDLVSRSHLTRGRLVFEVTESVAVANIDRAVEWIDSLKSLGCSFALDDFGSGFSSFTYLHSLPIEYVKIDGSYVSRLDVDPTSRSIVQSIAGVSHALGKKVIAEWVENEDIANLLKDFDIEYGQGFFWGQPRAGVLPETDAKIQVRARRGGRLRQTAQ